MNTMLLRNGTLYAPPVFNRKNELVEDVPDKIPKQNNIMDKEIVIEKQIPAAPKVNMNTVKKKKKKFKYIFIE